MRNLPRSVFFPLLILAIFVVLGIGYSRGQFEFVKQDEKKEITTPNKSTVGETGKIDLPVDLSNRNVTNILLSYNFFGPIKEVKTVDNGKQIVLDSTEKDLPDFILIDKDSKIFHLLEKNNTTPAKTDDLKAGLRVSISATYDIKTHVWVTRAVHIVDY